MRPSWWILGIVLLVGCSDDNGPTASRHPVEVAWRIEGDGRNHRWHGAVSHTGAVRSVSGPVPSTLRIGLIARGEIVGGTFQKEDRGGWQMTMCLMLNGSRHRCEATAVEFGVVSITERL